MTKRLHTLIHPHTLVYVNQLTHTDTHVLKEKKTNERIQIEREKKRKRDANDVN